MTANEHALLRAIQDGIPLTPTPFADLGTVAGISEAEVLATLRRWLDDGAIRRLGAFVDHHAVGRRANAMVAWEVPEDRLDAVGERLAADPQISHCYARPARPGWPYRLYTMVHADTDAELTAHIAALAADKTLSPRILKSRRQFKKTATRVRAPARSLP